MKITSLEDKPEIEDRIRVFLNRVLDYDFITRDTFDRVVRSDPNREPNLELVAMDNEDIIAVLLGVRRRVSPKEMVDVQREIAWIKVLAFDKSYPNINDVVIKLFKEYLERLKRYQIKQIRYADFASWYFFPGVDIRYERLYNLLLKLGFKKTSYVIDYELDLKAFRIPHRVSQAKENLRRENIIIRKAVWKEKERIINWVKDTFSPCWGYEVSCGFKDPDNITIWVATKNDKIVGFSAYSVLDKNWFGPVGVDLDFRGKGIGSVLLFEALRSLREEGYRYVTIPWTSHIFYYTQLSKYIIGIKHYVQMQKEIQ